MGGYQGKVFNSKEEAEEYVNEVVKSHPVVMFTFRFSPYCFKAKSAFKSINVQFEEIMISGRPDRNHLQDAFESITGARTLPRVFIHGKCIGGGDETQALNKQKKLEAMVKNIDEAQKEDSQQVEEVKPDQEKNAAPAEVKDEQAADDDKPDQSQETAAQVQDEAPAPQSTTAAEDGDQQTQQASEEQSEQSKDES